MSVETGSHVPNELHSVLEIPDGNRTEIRYGRGIENPYEWHVEGAHRIEEHIEVYKEEDVAQAMFWIFATANWGRDFEEIDSIFSLGEELIYKNLSKAKKDGTRLWAVGHKERLPFSFARAITKAEEETAHLTDRHVVFFVDYDGREDVRNAFRRIARSGKTHVTDEDIDRSLATSKLPYPNFDLVIRTGDTHRTSEVAPWQIKTAQIEFVPETYPLFDSDALKGVLKRYRDADIKSGR